MKIDELKQTLISNYKKRGFGNCIGSVEKVIEELFDGIDISIQFGKVLIDLKEQMKSQRQVSVEPEVKPEIAEVIKMINEEWRTVDSYDKTTFRAMYNKDRELSDFAKLVLESLKEKIKQQFSV